MLRDTVNFVKFTELIFSKPNAINHTTQQLERINSKRTLRGHFS